MAPAGAKAPVGRGLYALVSQELAALSAKLQGAAEAGRGVAEEAGARAWAALQGWLESVQVWLSGEGWGGGGPVGRQGCKGLCSGRRRARLGLAATLRWGARMPRHQPLRA